MPSRAGGRLQTPRPAARHKEFPSQDGLAINSAKRNTGTGAGEEGYRGSRAATRECRTGMPPLWRSRPPPTPSLRLVCWRLDARDQGTARLAAGECSGKARAKNLRRNSRCTPSASFSRGNRGNPHLRRQTARGSDKDTRDQTPRTHTARGGGLQLAQTGSTRQQQPTQCEASNSS